MTVLWSTYISAEPSSVESMDLKFNVIKTEFENKKKQYALKSDTPEQGWSLKWEPLDEDDINNIFNFYVARSGTYEAFYWYHPYEKTTLTQETSASTTLHVAQTMRVMVGDIILINTDVRTVASVDDANKHIVLTTNVSAAIGSVVQLRYTVRFGNELSLQTIKAWLYTLGLTFERDMG